MTTIPTFLNYATQVDLSNAPLPTGSLVSIQRADFTGTFNVMSWIDKITDDYDEYLIKVRGAYTPNVAGFGLRFGNGVTYKSDANYHWVMPASNSNASVYAAADNTQNTFIRLTDEGQVHNDGGGGLNMDINIWNARTTQGTTVEYKGGYRAASTNWNTMVGSGNYNVDEAHSSVQIFLTQGGNWTGGSMELFGVAK